MSSCKRRNGFRAHSRRRSRPSCPALAPAVVRSRFHFRETGSVPAMVEALDKIGARGSHGVIVKAPDTDLVAEAIDRLTAEGIPVVTFVTDVPRSSRVGYVGVDNRDAGATAAYLIDEWLGDSPASVLVTLSSNAFRGEEEREMGFRGEMRRALGGKGRAGWWISPKARGSTRPSNGWFSTRSTATPPSVAVYSIGGGNVATIRAFEQRGRSYRVFIAHDLDEDNRTLLRARKISAVLHHDLRADANLAGRMIIQSHGGMSRVAPSMSAVRVVTPHTWRDPGTASRGCGIRVATLSCQIEAVQCRVSGPGEGVAHRQAAKVAGHVPIETA